MVNTMGKGIHEVTVILLLIMAATLGLWIGVVISEFNIVLHYYLVDILGG